MSNDEEEQPARRTRISMNDFERKVLAESVEAETFPLIVGSMDPWHPEWNEQVKHVPAVMTATRRLLALGLVEIWRFRLLLNDEEASEFEDGYTVLGRADAEAAITDPRNWDPDTLDEDDFERGWAWTFAVAITSEGYRHTMD